MPTTGPIIEELPDDYDVNAIGTKDISGGSKGFGTSASSTLRRGFFNAPRSKHTELRTAAMPTPSACITTATATRVEPVKQAPTAVDEDDLYENTAGVIATPVAPVVVAAAENEAFCNPVDFVEGFRARLRTATESATQHNTEEVPRHDANAFEEVLAPIRRRPRWPTPQARSSRDKATSEVDVALAEMRAASNDARRLRGGDEKRALSELQRAADDALERLRKVVEASAPPEKSQKDCAAVTVAAFHVLPFTMKLRVLADERVAMALFGFFFLVGMVVILAICTEVYTALNCGLRCGL